MGGDPGTLNPTTWSYGGKGVWDIDPFGVYESLLPKEPEAPETPAFTPPPQTKEAEKVTRKKRREMGDFTGLGTILTGAQGVSPLGALIPANLQGKTYLGG